MRNLRVFFPSSVMLLSLLLTGCPSGSSPTPPPAKPTNVSAIARDGYVLVTATVASDATGVNVYWSASTGVTPANGAKVLVGSDPQAINGLTNNTTYYFIVTAVAAGGESAASAEVSATPVAATVAADPLYADQWHLNNTGQPDANGVAAAVGEDLDVEPAWVTTKGQGVTVAVVDDGLEIGHEDLASNIAANNLSYNYVTGTNDPTNSPADTASGHGTAVAGIIAARDANGLGGSGVAPRASLVGYNLLQTTLSSNEADAMTRNAASISISSNSWGATDNTGELDASTSLWKAAIDTGTSTGRSGKGTVYLWAAGNGGLVNAGACPYGCDSSNYDGRANYHGVMAVAAVNDHGTESSYSEQGANLWISAPGGEFCYPAPSYTTNQHAITTVDRTGEVGFNRTGASSEAYDYPASGNNINRNYTRCMNGTSSATPAAAGVVALMLAANANLGWRDVRQILATTARKNDPGTGSPISTTGWFANGAGFHYNHKYGFGVVDAAAAVTAAASYTSYLTGQPSTFEASHTSLNLAVPDNDNVTGVSDTIAVSSSGITSIEYVEVTFSATTAPLSGLTYTGDMAVTLTSPAGTTSVLAYPHVCTTNGATGACNTTYSAWVFGDAAHLGEVANGNWTLNVTDWFAGGTSTVTGWKIKFYGH